MPSFGTIAHGSPLDSQDSRFRHVRTVGRAFARLNYLGGNSRQEAAGARVPAMAPTARPNTSPPATRPASESVFGRALREWRARRGLSQLALAGDAGVSSRHLSFVETGRAQPSREMVLLLARALDVPLRDRNDLLTAAGYAAIYRETGFDMPAMTQARR